MLSYNIFSYSAVSFFAATLPKQNATTGMLDITLDLDWRNIFDRVYDHQRAQTSILYIYYYYCTGIFRLTLGSLFSCTEIATSAKQHFAR